MYLKERNEGRYLTLLSRNAFSLPMVPNILQRTKLMERRKKYFKTLEAFLCMPLLIFNVHYFKY